MFGIDECVFDGGADCIHECHQGLTLGVGAQENEEDLINKAFPKRLSGGKLGLLFRRFLSLKLKLTFKSTTEI